MTLSRTLILVLAISVLAGVLAVPATATDCTWTANNKPWWPPGLQDIHDTNDLKETAVPWWHPDPPEGHIWKHRKWNVIVKPGYMFGALYGHDDITWYIHSGDATIDKDYQRDCFYNVTRNSQCLIPVPSTKVTMSGLFNVEVFSDQPAEAHSAGLTHVKGTLTMAKIEVKAGCECGTEDTGATPAEVEFTFTVSGQTVTIPVKLKWGSDTQTDSASDSDVKTGAVQDEEYLIHHNIDQRVKASGSVTNWYGSASAWLKDHYLWIHTQPKCDGTCKKSADFHLIINKASEQVSEDF